MAASGVYGKCNILIFNNATLLNAVNLVGDGVPITSADIDRTMNS